MIPQEECENQWRYRDLRIAFFARDFFLFFRLHLKIRKSTIRPVSRKWVNGKPLLDL